MLKVFLGYWPHIEACFHYLYMLCDVMDCLGLQSCLVTHDGAEKNRRLATVIIIIIIIILYYATEAAQTQYNHTQ